MTWGGRLAEWWRREVASDEAYGRDVDPLVADLIEPAPDGLLLDLGCGEGRLTGRFGPAVGVDSSEALVRGANPAGKTVVGLAEHLPFGDGVFAGAYTVLTLEHIPDLGCALSEVGRVVRPSGKMAVVINHPAFTAPGSAPVLDPGDGEVLWRWGAYLEEGHSDEPAGDGEVRFHHRPLSALLSAFAGAGWWLELLVEAPSGDEDPILAAQIHFPRLLGGRWRNGGAVQTQGSRE